MHKISNVNKALDFIASKGVKLVSIGAEGERCNIVSYEILFYYTGWLSEHIDCSIISTKSRRPSAGAVISVSYILTGEKIPKSLYRRQENFLKGFPI